MSELQFDAEGWREFVRRRIAEQEGVPVESVNVNEWGTHVSVAKEGRTPVTIIQYVRKPTDQPGEAGEANE